MLVYQAIYKRSEHRDDPWHLPKARVGAQGVALRGQTHQAFLAKLNIPR